MKKIYLSTGYRKGIVICSIIPLIISLMAILYCLISGDFEPIIIIYPCIILEFIMLFDCVNNRKLLSYVTISDETFTSYSFFNKKLYALYLNYGVYYKICDGLAEFTSGKFIVLSNYRFECNKKLFIHMINHKKILVMPYNDKTKQFLKLDEWIKL